MAARQPHTCCCSCRCGDSHSVNIRRTPSSRASDGSDNGSASGDYDIDERGTSTPEFALQLNGVMQRSQCRSVARVTALAPACLSHSRAADLKVDYRQPCALMVVCASALTMQICFDSHHTRAFHALYFVQGYKEAMHAGGVFGALQHDSPKTQHFL